MSKRQADWFQGLLKSGLPLEGQVAALLARMGFAVLGEYPYMRVDETGTVKEHSVDLHARHVFGDLDWVDFKLLVECKYNHPGCSWVFVRGHMTGHGFGGAASLHEDLCPSRVSDHWEAKGRLWNVDGHGPQCMKGVVLQGKGDNTASIAHGTSQLRYAIPHLLSDSLQYQAFNWVDSRVKPVVLCPILVTNAPLWVLRKSTSIKKVERASGAGKLEDVAVPHNYLRVAQEQGPSLRAYTRVVMKPVTTSPTIEQRLSDANSILMPIRPELSTSVSNVAHHVEAATEVILVANVAHLGRLVRKYLNELGSLGRDIVHYATLVSDPPGRGARLRPAEGIFPKPALAQQMESMRSSGDPISDS